ncbi:MAG: polyprenyl synthetase family protein [Prevotella sp.]|nr:polyprenyl synthetase family protein [Prevotella sp.]MBQ9216542.1 polyprenyl synthetase family protein [Prevotella sp.]
MDYLQRIKSPIVREFEDFRSLFSEAMSHSDGLLSQALNHIRQRSGKQMRPMLTLLSAKNYGQISEVTLRSAVALELLHTASLTHDDVVDESDERRGVPSLNAAYSNKVAVLVGDYILSTCLLNVSIAGSKEILHDLSQLGRTLAAGEILQLQNITNKEISEQVYYQVIDQKTASLFQTCAGVGALSVGASKEDVEKAKIFGRNLGMIFQIRDDIFDYFDSDVVGKPTGADMAEGKLTLPVIYALNHSPYESMMPLALKVKAGTINADEIAVLVEFTKEYGGIEYAQQKMDEIANDVRLYIDENIKDPSLNDAYSAYLEYAINRNL